MLCRLISVLFISICLILPCHTALANYTVRNIAVDATGENTIEAKDKAFIEGRANAFKIVTERLMDVEEAESIQIPSDQVISTMIDNFEINREKSSQSRYLASMNITFNEQAIENYLGRITAVQSYDQPHMPFEEYNAQTMNALDHQDLTQSTMILDFEGFNNWITLKKSIQSIGMVGYLAVDQLQINRAVITVFHQGTVNQLQGSFIPNGLKLYNNRGEHRQIAPYILQKTSTL